MMPFYLPPAPPSHSLARLFNAPTIPTRISPASSFILSSDSSSLSSSSSLSYSTSFCKRIHLHLEHEGASPRRIHYDSAQQQFTSSQPSLANSLIMTNKRQVMVALFSREGHFFSQGSQGNREFDHNDFLWSIIIRPKKSNGHDSDCFDIRHVSAGPVRRDQPKPTGYWQFRKITQYEPIKDPRLLGQFMIGKVPHEVNYDHLVELLGSIRHPRREGEFHENGVHWIRAAIVRLQMSGLGEEFDVDGFLDIARDRAQAMATSHAERRPFLINYTDRPM